MAVLVLGVSDWQISVLAAVAGPTGAAVVVLLGPWVLLASVLLLPWKSWQPGPCSQHRAMPDRRTDAAKR